MKKIIFTTLSFVFTIPTVYSQKGIDFNLSYGAGRSLKMFVDSAAKNVYYDLKFPNQPNTSFNFLPGINNISLQFNFRKTTNIESYRYTILIDDKPIDVNKAFDSVKIFNTKRPKDTPFGNDLEEINSINLGKFVIKGKVIKILTYSVEKPLDIYVYTFYAKSIPKAKITALAKQFFIKDGVDHNHIWNPKQHIELKLNSKDNEITIVKERSDIDYAYHAVIKDKQNNEIIYESPIWQYGGYLDDIGNEQPYIKFDKNIFKKSRDYEIIIQPNIDWIGYFDCHMSSEEIEKYSSKYLITVDLEQEATFTTKELGIYIGATCVLIGAFAHLTMTYMKRKNKIKLATEQQQKQVAMLQLSSVRSQLNPHFLFNALAGIQNLMNKNETDNANKYLSKFARLTRNVLDNKELISIAQEKKLLDDYLQMEKLRFGFQYDITSSKNLDTENTEIPAMLLQPFVENAVKHGIAEKGYNGKIEIIFEKQEANLILQIKDNGLGFQTDKDYNGLGLALSKERITLLNSIHKETLIILDINSDTNGTAVSITLTEWA